MKRPIITALIGLLVSWPAMAADWNTDVRDQGVHLSITGLVTHGDRQHFVFVKNDCKRVIHTFSAYTTEPENFEKLKDNSFLIELNGERTEAKLDVAVKALSGHILFFNLGEYESSVLSNHLKKADTLQIEFIDGNGIKASDYFDVPFNEWSMSGVSEAFLHAYLTCTLVAESEKEQAPQIKHVKSLLDLLPLDCNEAANPQQCLERIRSQEVKRKARREARLKKQRDQENIILGVLTFFAVAIVVSIFMARRKIAVTFSAWWRRQSQGIRAWVFGSVSWAFGTLLYVWLVDPYGSPIFNMHYHELWHMFGVMLIPPLFLGTVWFGYKRFVVIEVAEIQPTEPIVELEDHGEQSQRNGTIKTEVQRPVSTTSEAPLPVGRRRGFKIFIKVVGSVITFTVLFFVSAAISELTAEKKFISQLSFALSIPFLIAIWHRAATSRRISAALIGSVAGIAVWGLGIAMLDSGISTNSVIISYVAVSSSMLVSGAITMLICRRQRASYTV